MSAFLDILEAIGDLGYAARSTPNLAQGSAKGCGPALEAARLRIGEQVLDLGCGSGGELAVAAKMVGSTGRAYGIDPDTRELDKALALLEQTKLQNAQLYQGSTDYIPLAEGSLDCVYANCVINLVQNKLGAFREVKRVLKPGGRFIFVDVVRIKSQVSPEACNVAAAILGCSNGVLLTSDYEDQLEASGFAEIKVSLFAALPFSKIERQAKTNGLAQHLELLDKHAINDALGSVIFECIKPMHHSEP